MIRTVVWCGSRLRPYPQATRGTFSEARSQSLATLPRRWVGSEGSGNYCTSHTKRTYGHNQPLAVSAELLGGIKKYCTCHTNKGGGVTSDTWVQVTRTSRRHRTYSTCHAKRTCGHKVLLGGRVTSAPATQNGNRVTRNFPRGIENIAPATQKESRVIIVANDLHLPHKKEVESQKMFGSIEKYCTCHTKKKVGSPLSPMICTCHTSMNVYARNFSEPSRILHLPHKKASRVTSVAKPWVTKYFSEALKLLRRPHKVTVNHLRTLPNKHV